jgi:hypothetical protein
MKRLMSIILVALLALPLLAQETVAEPKNKKVVKDYSEWLPKQGDWSVGFSLNPIATFVGNIFNGNTSNALDNLAGEVLNGEQLGLSNPLVSIVGSYMQTDKLSWKLNLGLGYSHKTNNAYVLDDAALYLDPLSRQKVVDSEIYDRLFGSVAFGIEYRVGKSLPVQGVFGVGLNYAFGHVTYDYTYGNAITELNQKPSISNSTLYEAVAGYMPNARPLHTEATDVIHMIGAYASVGVECFVAPKVALGANVNFGVYYGITPACSNTYEGWNTANMQVEQFTDLIAPASSGFHVGTENIGANLYIAFYFNGK